MVKISTIFGLGVLVFLTGTGFLGLPLDWKNFIYIASGLAIAALSILLRRELHEVLRHLHSDEVKTDAFTERMPKDGTM